MKLTTDHPTKEEDKTMNIEINTQIFSGNLGDGWKDDMEAARKLAAFTDRTWKNDLGEVSGHDINIDIDVQAASGDSRSVSVDIDAPDDKMDAVMEFQREIELALTDEQEIWRRFCSSDEAQDLYDDD